MGRSTQGVTLINLDDGEKLAGLERVVGTRRTKTTKSNARQAARGPGARTHDGAQCANFSAGPAALPEPVLQRAQAEMLDWHGSGMSVMEMSHRGKEFMSIIAKAEADLRELLAIPANYKVLFLQGGAIAQNAIVPMNLLRGKAARRLRRHRRLVEEVDHGSAASTAA